ncbi:hypothetical protein GCM10007860_17440 [Chitiniphilus shinanonensis]|uniref:Secreted protein n=1 Tax=Chitiniphilus shinanonensis TaxID=553088 RepID=A0ABQ6BWM4_9NEIS|nr:hypothetical protein [Chitiniphilus shinanonensis]GLS04597.1 hypothetical protein GCM10007860_17440 [Chitiniphilus shinanonensis]
MKPTLASIGRVVALLAVAGFAAQYLGWIDLSPRRDTEPPAKVDCPALERGCDFESGQQRYRVSSDQKLTANRVFLLTLRGPASDVAAEWRMQGMDMGPNRRPMQPSGDSRWQLQTALPFCSAARHDWQLVLTIDRRQVVVETRSMG